LYEEASSLILQARRDGAELWISRQVIREYLVQVTRPGLFERPLDSIQATEKAVTLRSLFAVADEDERVTNQLLRLLRDYSFGGKQIHDANIVATMLTYGIQKLVTTNYAGMKRFEGVVEVIHLQSAV
jgi:predicted nucleic acid-binding protein